MPTSAGTAPAADVLHVFAGLSARQVVLSETCDRVPHTATERIPGAASGESLGPRPCGVGEVDPFVTLPRSCFEIAVLFGCGVACAQGRAGRVCSAAGPGPRGRKEQRPS